MSSSGATGTWHCLTSHPRPTDVQGWRDGLPESLADSRTAELLEHVCDVDLDALDVELPRGWNLVDLTEWSEPFCCSSSS